jgi:hypothetical protein
MRCLHVPVYTQHFLSSTDSASFSNQGFAVAMAKRLFAKNTSSSTEIANLLRARHPDCDATRVPQSDEEVAEKYHSVINDLLHWTPRLNVKLLTEASKNAYKVEESAALRFARALTDVVSLCRLKSKSVTSGKKQSKAMYSIQSTLRALQAETLKRHLWPGARQLSRKLSEESEKKQKTPRATSSGSGRGPLLDPCSIMNLYGHAAATSSPVSSHPLLSSASSEEEIECIDASQTSQTPLPICSGSTSSADVVHFFDSSKNAMVRALPSGSIEIATMSEGPNGFAIATFQNGLSMDTECPNLLLAMPLNLVRKKPAKAAPASPGSEEDSAMEEELVQKKPAARKRPAAACVPTDTPAPTVLPIPHLPVKVAGAHKPTNLNFDAEKHGPCRAEFYTAKSYIRSFLDPSKPKLIIGDTSSGHWAVVQRMVSHVKAGASKEALVKIRAQFVEHL